MIHFFFLIIPDIVITAETLFLTTIHQHQIEESLQMERERPCYLTIMMRDHYQMQLRRTEEET